MPTGKSDRLRRRATSRRSTPGTPSRERFHLEPPLTRECNGDEALARAGTDSGRGSRSPQQRRRVRRRARRPVRCRRERALQRFRADASVRRNASVRRTRSRMRKAKVSRLPFDTSTSSAAAEDLWPLFAGRRYLSAAGHNSSRWNAATRSARSGQLLRAPRRPSVARVLPMNTSLGAAGVGLHRSAQQEALSMPAPDYRSSSHGCSAPWRGRRQVSQRAPNPAHERQPQTL